MLASPVAAANRWDEMDYGPFLSSSVTMQYAKNGEDVSGIVMKGITVQLAPNIAATFDTMLMRWAGVWSSEKGERPLKLYGTPFDGTHRPPERSRPVANGALLFQTRAIPGWAGADGSLEDPRSEPYIPLPKDWAHWRGLSVHGKQVVMSYTVQDAVISELLEAKAADGVSWIERTFEVGPTKAPLSLVVCDAPDAAKINGAAIDFADGENATGAVWNAAEKNFAAKWRVADGVAVLMIPALSAPTRLAVRIRHGAASAAPAPDVWSKVAAAPVADIRALTKGGPARYPEAVTTAGKPGMKGGAYEVDTLALPDENPWHAWMRVGGFDFFSDPSRAAICTWSGDVWTVNGIDASLGKLEWRRVASGLFQPLGLKIIKDDIYVLGRDQITRLRDLNGDGEADYYENFNNDYSCTANFHEFATDLQADAAGNFYFGKSAPLLGTEKWDPVGKHNGCYLRVSADGLKLDVIATGVRATNGGGVGPNGELACTDNEGIWTPVCRLNAIKPGMFLGAVGMDHRAAPPTTYDPPLCWVPYAIDNSSGGEAWVTSDKWGPFKGEQLHLSYGKCALFHVLKEECNGIAQGGIVQIPARFDSGGMRGRFNAGDGQLYVGGLRGWQSDGSRDGCFQRVRYTGKPVETVASLHVIKDGLTLSFTTPLDPASVADLDNYDLQQWNYLWSASYGSSLYSVNDPKKITGKKGELKGDAVTIAAAKLSPDGKTVTLAIPGLRPVMQMMTRVRLKTAANQPLSADIYHTINAVP